MEHSQKTVLSLLFLTVVVSGCLNGGMDTDGPEAIEIQELSVNPTTVYEGSSTRAVLEASNIGNIPGEIEVETVNGSNILTDYCQDMLSIEDFSYTAPPQAGTGGEYELDSGDGMRFVWDLEQEGTVPLYDLSCDLNFRLPFNYSVQATSQIQVKEDLSVEGADSLEAQSSSGPMLAAIETIPGAAEQASTYSMEDDDTITVNMQLQNQETEDGYGTGVVNVDSEALTIDASDELRNGEDIEELCEIPEEGLTMHEGGSELITCDFEVPEDINGPAQIFDIEVGVDYTYVRNAGTRSVEVTQRG